MYEEQRKLTQYEFNKLLSPGDGKYTFKGNQIRKLSYSELIAK